MADTLPNKPSAQNIPQNSLEHQRESAQQETQKQTREQTDLLKAPAETTAETRSNLKNLEESFSLLTPEKLQELDTQYATEISTINLSKLPQNTETEKQQHVQNFIVSSVGLVMKVLKNQPDLELEKAEKLFSLQLNAQEYSPLERTTFTLLKKVFARTNIDPTLHQLIFSDWKNDVAQLREKVYPKKQQEEKKANQESTLSKIGDALSQAGGQLSSSLGTNGKMLGAAGGTAALVFLLYKLIPKDESKGFFSFGKIMSFAAASLGGLFGFSLLKNVDFKSLFGSIGSYFGGAPAYAADDLNTKEPSRLSEHKDWIPLKSALGNYTEELNIQLSPVKKELINNKVALTAVGGYLSATHATELLQFAGGSAGAGVGSLMSLAKLGLGTVHSYPLASLFGVSALLMHQEKLNPGKLKVPPDPASLAIFLEEKVEEHREFFVENGLEIPSKADLDTTAQLLNDPKQLKKYLGNAGALANSVFEKGIDKMTTTTKELVAQKNKKGLEMFQQDILIFAKDREDTRDKYLAAVESINLLLSKKGTISTIEVNTMMKTINDLHIGINVYREDGYIKYDYVDNKVFQKLNRQICIDPNPTLSEKELLVKAKNFTASESIKDAVGAIGDNVFLEGTNMLAGGAQNTVNMFKGIASKEHMTEKVVEAIKQGFQLTIEGGDVFLSSASQRYVFGPASTVRWLLTELPRGECHEFLLRYNEGVVPVMLVTIAGVAVPHTLLFRHRYKGFQHLAPIAKGATYPITGLFDIGKTLLRPAIMKMNGTAFKDIGIDPFAQLRTTVDSLNHGLRSHGLSGANAIKKSHADISDLSKAHDLMLHSRGRVSRNNALGVFVGSTQDLESAKAFLQKTDIGEKLLVDYKNVDQQNLKSWLKAMPDIIAHEKAKLKEHKVLMPLEEALEKAQKKNNVQLIQELTGKVDAVKARIAELEKTFSAKMPAWKGEVAPKTQGLDVEKTLSSLEDNAKNASLHSLEEHKATLRTAEETIRAQAERVSKIKDLDEVQKKGLLERLNAYCARLQEVKLTMFGKIKAQFDSLPKGAHKNSLVPQVNSILESGDQSLMKTIKVAGGKRLISYAAQFTTLLAVQKSVEVAMDPYHDFEKAIAGVASKETLQLMVDLLPIAGFSSNFISAATGKELVTGNDASRLEMLGWGFVNLGQDVIAFIPLFGQSARLAAFMAKLSAAAEAGKISGKVLEAMRAFPALAKANPTEAWSALWRGLHKHQGAIKLATHTATAGMMAVTIGPMVMSYVNAREVEPAQADTL